jgi:hypothetical protein
MNASAIAGGSAMAQKKLTRRKKRRSDMVASLFELLSFDLLLLQALELHRAAVVKILAMTLPRALGGVLQAIVADELAVIVFGICGEAVALVTKV